MGEKLIRVLVIDDNEEDFLIVQRLLSQCERYRFDCEHVPDHGAAVQRINEKKHHLCVFDLRKRGRSHLSLIRQAVAQGPRRTVLILSGEGDSQPTGSMQDSTNELEYCHDTGEILVRGELTVDVLERSIHQALQNDELVERLLDRASEKEALYRISTAIEQATTLPDLLRSTVQVLGECLKQPALWGVRIQFNGACYDSVDSSAGEKVLQLRFQPHHGWKGTLSVFRRANQSSENAPLPARDVQLLEAVAQNLTEAIDRIRSEQEVRSLARFVADNPNPVLRLSAEGELVFANKAADALLHRPAGGIQPRCRKSWKQIAVEVLRENRTQEHEFEHDGAHFSLLFVPIADEQYVNVYGTEITKRKQIEQTLQERVELAALAAEVGLVLTRGGLLHEALQGCAAAIVSHSRATQARIWRFNPHDRILELHASAGFHTHLTGLHRRVRLGEGCLGWIAENKKVFVTDSLGDEGFGEEFAWAVQENLQSFAGFPLIVNDQLLGVLGIYSPQPFSHETIETFTSLADEIALGMEQKEAAQSRSRLVALLEATPDFVAISDTDYHGVYLNQAARKMLGIAASDDPAHVNLLRCTPKWVQELLDKEILPQVFSEGFWQGELAITGCDGTEVPVSQVILAHFSPRGTVEYVSTIARDISESKRLEDQLRQSQKLEGIGRLAGGVAHDFNNLLTGIRGFADLALQETNNENVVEDLLQIRQISDRSADLTRQLLAFSRRQPMSPMVTNINHLVDRTSRLLRRLIGEDVELVFTLDPNLGNVRVDPGQIEQILVNLAVNARDAMPQGGRLLIETSNAMLSKEYLSQHAGVSLGQHVMLAVTDSGCGMDTQTRERIFEPFFTTKPMGQGTGLGLSTVYGIVKQQMGSIWVYSEPQRGTTFKIYFPLVSEAEDPEVETDSPATLNGDEVILVVEDEDSVREVTRRILTGYGYSVLCARDPHEARQLFLRNPNIALLLSDVVMPGISGSELYQQLSAIYPSLKVLYMSGYTDKAIVHHGVLEPDASFIQKPFNAKDLARKLRSVLDN